MIGFLNPHSPSQRRYQHHDVATTYSFTSASISLHSDHVSRLLPRWRQHLILDKTPWPKISKSKIVLRDKTTHAKPHRCSKLDLHRTLKNTRTGHVNICRTVWHITIKYTKWFFGVQVRMWQLVLDRLFLMKIYWLPKFIWRKFDDVKEYLMKFRWGYESCLVKV